MTALINASTSSGVVVTSDTSGSLAFQSNGTTIMTVASTGVSTQVGAPAFSAYRSGAQTGVSQGSWTKVQFNAEVFDTANAYDSTTNYRFTPQVAGYYQITASVTDVTGVSGSYQYGAIYKNGTYYCKSLSQSGSNGVTSNVSAIVSLNGSTDYIEIYYFMSGSGTVGIDGSTGSGYNTWVSGALIRSA